MFGYFAQSASPTGYEPNEHNLKTSPRALIASTQGDSGMSSTSMSSDSMLEVAVATIPGTESGNAGPYYFAHVMIISQSAHNLKHKK